MKQKPMTIYDLYIQLCEKANCKLFDFGPFVVEFIEGNLNSNVLSKLSLIKAVKGINKDIEEEEVIINGKNQD